MKHATACPQCRTAKRKCTQDPADSESACLACQSRKIECSRPWKRPRSSHLPSRVLPKITPSTSVGATDLPIKFASDKDIRDYIRLYLRYIHDRPHSLFHEQSLWNAVCNCSLPVSLSTAICALGCRFVQESDQQKLSPTFMIRSKALLAKQLEDISVTNIQTCVLLANSYAAEQNNRLEALYFGEFHMTVHATGLIRIRHRQPYGVRARSPSMQSKRRPNPARNEITCLVVSIYGRQMVSPRPRHTT